MKTLKYKNKKLLLIMVTSFILAFLSFNSDTHSQSQEFIWAKSAGDLKKDIGMSVATDGSGNCYVTGYFEGTANFGSATLTSAGLTDMFIAKFDALGNVNWAKRIGDLNLDHGSSIVVDHAGNILVTGRFLGTVNFDSIILTSEANKSDIFVAKYDASGRAVWAKDASGSGSISGESVAVDEFDNVYVTGLYTGSIIFGTTTLTA